MTRNPNVEDPAAIVTCECGSGWWEIRRPTNTTPAGLAIDTTGAVVAYSGELHCIECGAVKPAHDARPELRVVDPI